MNRILKSILLLGVLFSNSICFSQVLIVNTSAACACDGAFTFSPEPGQPTFFELLSSEGVSLQTSGQAAGTWNLTGLCEGVYIVTATTASASYQEFIQINNAIAPIADFGETSICSTAPNTNLNTFITGFSAGGTWALPDGNFFNGIYNPSLHGSGFYSYTINNGTCDQVTGVFVTEIQNANAGIQTTYLICDNYAPFNMIDFLEGNPDTGGQWLTAGGTPMNGIYDPATMASGLFVYAIDNVPGCNAVFTTMFVDERITPNAGTNSSLIVCNGSPAFNLFNQIPGNPNPGGFWFRPNGTPFNGVFNPAIDPAGNYRYVVTANAPCQDAESIITITFSNTDPSGTSNQIEVCTSQSAFDMISVLNGLPISGGTWTNQQGQIVSSNFNPSINNSGIFNYYYPNVGCNAQGAQLTVNVLSAPNAGVDVLTELCVSSTPINLDNLLQNETPGGAYQNTLGQVISNVVNISSTQLFQARYVVTSTVCPSDTAQIIIGVVAPPVQPTNQIQEVCSNSGLINLNDYYQAVVFPQWQDSNGNQVPAQYDPLAGDVTLTIISLSQNACPNESATLQISVTDPAFTDALIQEVACTSDFPIDLNDYITAQAFGLGSWSDLSGNNVSNTIIQLSQGNYEYNYTSNNNGPCAASQITLELQVFEAVEAGSDNSIVVCESDTSFELEALLSTGAQMGGTWFNDGVPFAPQDYTLQGGVIDVIVYELAGNLGCAPDAAQFFIDVHSEVTADAGENISLCFGETNVQIGSQGLPNLSYSWIPSSLLSDYNDPMPIITLNGLNNEDQFLIFTLAVTDGVCTAQDEVEVTIHATPEVIIPTNIEICNGENISYNIDPNLSCIWTPSNLFQDFTSNTPTISPAQDVVLNLLVENQNGCQSNETSSIEVRPLPLIDFEMEPHSACSPLVVEQTWNSAAGLDYDIEWNSGNGDQDAGIDFLFNYTEAGVYSINLSVSNSFGCVSDTTYENVIEVFPNPIADFSYSPNPPSIINNIVFFENNSSSATTFEWTLDSQVLGNEENLLYEFPGDRAGDYTICLEITNEFGCEATHCEYLEIKNDFTFYAPNAFTPDDDGLNDVFKPELIGFDVSTYSLKIFDRWGTLVFSTNDISEPWIGNVRNGDYYAMQGVYNWIVEVKVDRLADFKTFKGSVMLLR
jgi:gliding motility-associated-like protein